MASHTSTLAAPVSRSWLTLRNVLRFDALTCAALGVLLLAAPGPLSALLGAPAALLQWAGIVLFPSAAAMLLAASTGTPWMVRLVVFGNLAWIVASVAVLVLSPLTLPGVAFVIVQAAAVAVLAWLEATLAR